MPDPVVSVIMAVRNGERFLARAIDSVLAQSYHPHEILVVDGQSTDATAAIARSYPQVRYVMQTGRGIADAYNLGIQTAQGDILSFLSYDDVWTPNKLALQLDTLIRNPEIQCAVANVKFTLEPGESPPPGFRPEWLTGDHPAYIMETLVARRSVFELVGLFDNAFPTGEDVDWFARAKDKKVPIALVPEVLLIKHIHNRNLSLVTPDNNRSLLLALRRSIIRKRQ